MTRSGIVSSVLLLAASLGCEAQAPSRYAVPVQTEVQVGAALEATCLRAVAEGQPLLLEFSAPWCSDCQRLHRMKQADALASELERWPKLVVNVGHFDLHTDLLAAFGVENIAHWAVLSPNDCSPPVGSWPRLAERKLEPETGEERTVSAADLAAWLAAYRRP